tara:strand:- start:38 stop:379 length:342 start_codon:yes stop_codon:yes gene_type:complete
MYFQAAFFECGAAAQTVCLGRLFDFSRLQVLKTPELELCQFAMHPDHSNPNFLRGLGLYLATNGSKCSVVSVWLQDFHQASSRASYSEFQIYGTRNRWRPIANNSDIDKTTAS